MQIKVDICKCLYQGLSAELSDYWYIAVIYHMTQHVFWEERTRQKYIKRYKGKAIPVTGREGP
jgi:hypothetical protein